MEHPDKEVSAAGKEDHKRRTGLPAHEHKACVPLIEVFLLLLLGIEVVEHLMTGIHVIDETVQSVQLRLRIGMGEPEIIVADVSHRHVCRIPSVLIITP